MATKPGISPSRGSSIRVYSGGAGHPTRSAVSAAGAFFPRILPRALRQCMSPARYSSGPLAKEPPASTGGGPGQNPQSMRSSAGACLLHPPGVTVRSQRTPHPLMLREGGSLGVGGAMLRPPGHYQTRPVAPMCRWRPLPGERRVGIAKKRQRRRVLDVLEVCSAYRWVDPVQGAEATYGTDPQQASR